MIEWFTTIAIIVSVIAGLAALVLGGIGRKPDDYSVLPTAAVAAGWTVDDMAMADLPYAPPYSQAINHAIATAARA